MMQNPAILALLTSSFLISLMLLYACWYGAKILMKWDLQSGSDLQLILERRTYLISTILGYAFVFEILSLFLYIFTADSIHVQFAGAMCAAGSLNVDSYGYPTLVLKIVNCLLAGVWLIINHADNQGFDYPLIRYKYTLLMILAPLVYLEAVLQYGYFNGLHADVITSCCGSLFSVNRRGIGGDLAGLPAGPMEMLFYGGMAVTLITGLLFCLKGKGGYLFSFASFLTFIVSVAALISFICLYIYELPTHHCPFCILQKEYGYVGYLLYGTLLGGGVTGLGVGMLMPFRDVGSLVRDVPRIQRRLALATLSLYLLFTLIVTYRMLATSFRL